MENGYTNERNIQMLISLMKSHNIKKIIASPGTSNISFVASVQQDSFFEVYSSVDERSAAYMACGMAAESGEPVAISCTGATASRNYLPGLTEAFYRKLPVLAITSTQHIGRIDQNIPQVLDRSVQPKDTVKMSVQIPSIHDNDDAKGCNILINKALLDLRANGGGPVHINLTTNYSQDFSVKKLPESRVINRYSVGNDLPKIRQSEVAVFVGSHKKWNNRLIAKVENFCANNNGVILCDQISNYTGKYGVPLNIITSQESSAEPLLNIPLLIYIGDISGSNVGFHPDEVWRVSPDGTVRDPFGSLSSVFNMSEDYFFSHYSEINKQYTNTNYFDEWNKRIKELYSKVPKLPFSNVWMAKQTVSLLPKNSVLHLGILNSLRSWNYFNIRKDILGYSNTGGFGIDGGISSLLGASLVNKNKLYFGIFGDLAFFYDLNANGNRYLGNNIRIMVVNNGRGTEFKNYNNTGALFGKKADKYIAAAGHFGAQSKSLLKNFSTDLGYNYISANDKKSYLKNLNEFVSPDFSDKPILFEVFTDSDQESEAVKIMNNLDVSPKNEIKNYIKSILGPNKMRIIKNYLGKK